MRFGARVCDDFRERRTEIQVLLGQQRAFHRVAGQVVAKRGYLGRAARCRRRASSTDRSPLRCCLPPQGRSSRSARRRVYLATPSQRRDKSPDADTFQAAETTVVHKAWVLNCTRSRPALAWRSVRLGTAARTLRSTAADVRRDSPANDCGVAASRPQPVNTRRGTR